MVEPLENEHARALAHDEAVAVAAEGLARLRRLALRGAEGRQPVEAGDAKHVDHGVRAAGEHHVGVAAADDAERLADRLRARRARGQAVVRGAADAELPREMRKRHVGLLLDLARRAHQSKRRLDPIPSIDLVRRRIPPGEVARRVGIEVEHAFTGPEVEPYATAIELRERIEVRLPPRLARRPQRKGAVEPRVRVHGGILHELREVVVADLAREGGRKGAGVEAVDRRDAALARQQPLPDALEIVPERRHPAHAGDDDAIAIARCGEVLGGHLRKPSSGAPRRPARRGRCSPRAPSAAKPRGTAPARRRAPRRGRR